jgi:2-polyprenyl-6-hydroxyphenyl methylase/3-demethylubiquinone-9 3-methyltransferase
VLNLSDVTRLATEALAPTALNPASPSVLAAEVAKFDALAAEWWNPRGPMRPLHAMNPARIGWIDTRLRAAGLAGTTVLDVGCGAGLAAESLASAGYDVVGIDAAPGPIAAARAHAPAGLTLRYEQTTAEHLAESGVCFGAITALEVIEHVADPAGFVASLARLLRPGGLLFVSTLNRTPRAYVTAKLGAEYLLRLLPVGTHEFRRFVTPAELAGYCRQAGLLVDGLAGLQPELSGRWRVTRDLSVNYIGAASRAR